MTYTIPVLQPIGDGKTDDTVAIQSMLDAEPVVVLPRPRVGYLVSSLRLNRGQWLSGPGRYQPCLIGDGTGTVLAPKTVDGLSRDITVSHLNVRGKGVKCFGCYYSPNLKIHDCDFLSYGSDCVDIQYSWRVKVQDNFLASSGEYFTALKIANNVNGLMLTGNTVTGGAGGRAIVVEQSQALTIMGNIIEASLHGLAVSSTDDIGKGNCNGVVVKGNHIEQCSTPFSFGTRSTVFGLDCSNNYIGNTAVSSVVQREAAFSIGRLQQSTIQNNTIWIHPSEDLFRFYWITPGGAAGNVSVLQDTVIGSNYVYGKPANYAQYLGQYGPNQSVKRAVGAYGYFDFCNDFNSHGTLDKREWVSPTINSKEGLEPCAWLPAAGLELGGKIFAVELLDVSKPLPGCLLQIGRASKAGETVNQDLRMVPVVNGCGTCELNTETPLIWSTEDNLIRVSRATSEPTNFRIKITYRAQ